MPIPESDSKSRIKLANLAERCTEAAKRRANVQSGFKHRILKDLAPPERQKLGSKLENFWLLDFATFRAEVTRAFKTEIPLKDRDDWEKYLNEKSTEVTKLTSEIEAAELEIDAIVYKLFELTPAEIKLLESSLEG